MAFAITYEEFVARTTDMYGEGEAQRLCPGYGRTFAQDCRRRAAAVGPDDAAVLVRLADQMDPDLRTGALADAPA